MNDKGKFSKNSCKKINSNSYTNKKKLIEVWAIDKRFYHFYHVKVETLAKKMVLNHFDR